MAYIIACANHKGGVGKSTTVANLGAALALERKRVLVVDLDPQGSLGISLGIDIEGLTESLYETLADADKTPLLRIVQKTSVPGLAIVPSNLDLASAEVDFLTEVGHDRLLADAIAPVADAYDFILIDCPPSLGLLTINALVAAQLVLVPLQAEYLAMRGIKQLLKAVSKVRKRANPRLRLSVVVTMATTTLHSREVIDEIREVRGEEVLETVIKRSIRFADASVHGNPIVVAAPTSEQAKSYRKLAQEVKRCQTAPIATVA